VLDPERQAVETGAALEIGARVNGIESSLGALADQAGQ
jgi:hypothetical protein